MLQGNENSNARAKQLRGETTLPEGLLWQRLRSRPGGLKFRRQHPAGPYVADFYCHKARLIVEIDGISHDMGDGPEADAMRDQYFRDLGFKVVRIPAKDVLRDPDDVAASIVVFATGVT